MTDITHDDLVKRLRYLGDHASFEPHMHHTAADRIEELEAENKRLRLEAAHANDTADAAIERAKELEAANKRLNEQMDAIEEMGTESLNALPDCLMRLAPALVENDKLKAKLAKVIAAYRIEAMRRDDYRHTAFNQHIVELIGQGDE